MNKIQNKEIILIDKPKHFTSNDVLNKVKSILKVKKAGHGGTLDPLATGLLIVAVNNATKQLSNYLADAKTYLAEIEFGYSTDTYDLEGKVVSKSEYIPTIEQIKSILDELKLEYNQTPPIYSAIKINGKKAYQLARENKTIELVAKSVQLKSYKIIEYANNILKIEIEVSKGFYVRSLANDLGILLSSDATLINLRRTKIGNIDVKDAIRIEDLYDYWN